MADSDRELISRLLGRSSRPAVKDHDTRPKTAARVRELEKALAAERMRSTMAERRAELAEARARETLKFAMWGGGRRQG